MSKLKRSIPKIAKKIDSVKNHYNLEHIIISSNKEAGLNLNIMQTQQTKSINLKFRITYVAFTNIILLILLL